jgi:hypothetical protein
VTAETHAERLLRIALSLEEAIIRLEASSPHATDTVHRLRGLQGEILTVLFYLESDSQPRV